jgi:hypothetical protein
MTGKDRLLVFILRANGVVMLFAIPAIFMPFSWMQAIHGWLGLGELPERPIISYLARSTSALYVGFGIIWLFLAQDVERYRDAIHLQGVLCLLLGASLLIADLQAEMPLAWVVFEMGYLFVVGGLIVVLCRPNSTPGAAGQ